MKSLATLLIVGLLPAFASAQEALPPPTPGTGSHVHHPTGPGGLGDDDGSGGGGGSEGGCSGQAKEYPTGWTFKAVYKYSTTFSSVCDGYLYQKNGELDSYYGDGDCEVLCSQNIGRASDAK